MLLLVVILLLMILVLFGYFYAGVSGIKARNQELTAQVQELNEQLDLVAEKEAAARREADIAFNAKVKLLSLLSHQIRTPMNGVMGMATLLSGTDLNKEQREYADTILDCSTNLLSNVDEILITDMLDFSKVDAQNAELKNKSFDLRNCIEEVMRVFAAKAAEAGIELLYQVDSNVPLQINGDYKRLQQVFINLIENAINATKKGEIILNVSLISKADGEFKIGFSVIDTGKGIEAQKMPYLFKGVLPLDYSSNGNKVTSGFGLVICKRLVGQMGGEISAESKEGVGSEFKFSIVTSVSDVAVADYINNRMMGFEGKQILVVDDNQASLSILAKQLEDWKLLPVSANSAEQGLEILSQVSVDLVVTDLQMPGMDGIEFTKQIKDKYPNTPVILLNSKDDDSYKLHADIFSSVISKPVMLHALFDSLLTGIRSNDVNITSGSLQQVPEDFSEKYPLTILVAEDNPVNQTWIKQVLSKIGYECDIAENGKVVMEKVSVENYDLVLMDVRMPEMDGLEATRMIRVCLEVQPVIIAMTANAMQGDRDICIQSGMNDYISKPVKLPVLLNMLEKWALLIKEKRESVIENNML